MGQLGNHEICYHEIMFEICGLVVVVLQSNPIPLKLVFSQVIQDRIICKELAPGFNLLMFHSMGHQQMSLVF